MFEQKENPSARRLPRKGDPDACRARTRPWERLPRYFSKGQSGGRCTEWKIISSQEMIEARDGGNTRGNWNVPNRTLCQRQPGRGLRSGAGESDPRLPRGSWGMTVTREGAATSTAFARGRLLVKAGGGFKHRLARPRASHLPELWCTLNVPATAGSAVELL